MFLEHPGKTGETIETVVQVEKIFKSTWADGEDPRVTAVDGEDPKSPFEELYILRSPHVYVETSRVPCKDRQDPSASWKDSKGPELT